MSNTPLYKQIQHKIKHKISSGELRPKDRVPSERELADQFRVSQITAKNALIGLADEGIVVRIQGKGTFVAEEPFQSGHIKKPQPQSIKKHNFIGLILPTLRTQVIQRLVESIILFANQSNYQIILRITRESSDVETKMIRELMELGVKGIIIFPTEDENYSEPILRLSLERYPLVLIDRYFRNITTFSVCSDNVRGAYDAVSYLLNKGHEQIALISSENSNTVIEDRTVGYEKAFLDHKLSIDQDLWFHIPLHVLRSDRCLPAIVDFLDERKKVSAVFTLTEEIARQTFTALQLLGRKIPDDIEMITFDEPELNIPCVLQDEHHIGKSAVELLIAQITGKKVPASKHIVIPVELQTNENLNEIYNES